MKQAEAFRLLDWIKKNRTRIETEKPTQATAATWATIELGMPVTQSNIRTVVSNMPGHFKWPRNLARQSEMMRRKKDAHIVQVNAELFQLKVMVQALCESLGVEYTDPCCITPPQKKECSHDD